MSNEYYREAIENIRSYLREELEELEELEEPQTKQPTPELKIQKELK